MKTTDPELEAWGLCFYRTKVMRENTYNIKKDTIRTHFSLAKFFFVLAGTLILIGGCLYVYNKFIRSEPLDFYKDIENCRVVTYSETSTSHTYSGGSRTRTDYYVNVYTPDGERDVKLAVSKDYYIKMSLYDKRDNVKLSFFKTKKGSLFPTYTPGVSEREAGRQYMECYPPTVVYTVSAIIACIGGVFLIVGLLALRTARQHNDELTAEVAQTGVEKSEDDVFLREFDEAMQRDNFRRTRSPRSLRGNVAAEPEEQISPQQREEFLDEFYKLTASGKYNYKSH